MILAICPGIEGRVLEALTLCRRWSGQNARPIAALLALGDLPLVHDFSFARRPAPPLTARRIADLVHERMRPSLSLITLSGEQDDMTLLERLSIERFAQAPGTPIEVERLDRRICSAPGAARWLLSHRGETVALAVLGFRPSPADGQGRSVEKGVARTASRPPRVPPRPQSLVDTFEGSVDLVLMHDSPEICLERGGAARHPGAQGAGLIRRSKPAVVVHGHARAGDRIWQYESSAIASLTPWPQRGGSFRIAIVDTAARTVDIYPPLQGVSVSSPIPTK